MYRWWVFVHVMGVLAFLATHGVSFFVTFRLRSERDPGRIDQLIQLSAATIPAFYASTAVMLLGGTVAGFLGDWWGHAWIWASILIFVVTSAAMYAMARPYFRRVGLVARAVAEGSQAVGQEQLASVLRSGQPITIAAIGFGGLLLILYLMMFQPGLGFGTGAAPGPASPGTGGDAVLPIVAPDDRAFSTDSLTASADAPFEIVFTNQDPGVLHNVAIYTDGSAAEALFVGELVEGPATVTYGVDALPPGTYVFLCDVHPWMEGTLTAE